MVHINQEGRINENAYLIDGLLFRTKGNIALYVLEKNDERMLIDTSSALAARSIVKQLKQLNLFPIHKLLLTHSHWDHSQGAGKLKKLIGEELEVLAHQNAIEHLKSPKKLIEAFGYNIDPVESITPLKEGDIINLSGLELEIFEFFGHTYDSIAILDKKNKDLYVGDALFYIFDKNTYIPNIMPPFFNEKTLLKSFDRLENIRTDIKSVGLAHYGLYTNDDLDWIIQNVKELYFKCRDVIIKAYKDNPDYESMAKCYYQEILKESEIFPKKHLGAVALFMEWLSNGLKAGKLI
ncbi:MAG: MBL fold metallo-hydrolase [Promethearchaeota archaeon]